MYKTSIHSNIILINECQVEKVGCPAGTGTACIERIVKEKCHGKPECIITASNKVLKADLECGEKKLKISYR